MKSKLRICIIIFFIILFGYCIKSNATISTESKQVNSGEQFSITVSSDIPVVSYKIDVTGYSGLQFITSSGGTGAGGTSISNATTTGNTTLATFVFKAPDVTSDTQYSINISASEMGDEQLNPVGNSSCTATITVKAPEAPIDPTPAPDPVQPETPATDPGSTESPTPSTGNSDGNTTTTTTTTGDNTSDNKKSSEATLSNLGIRPNDFTGFTRNKYEYDVEVPNDVAEVEVYAIPRDSKAKVTGTGKVKLDVGENKLNVVVTAEDGTTKTYTINVTRVASEDEEKTDNTENPEEKTLALQALSITNVNLSPKFDPEKYEYTVGITEDLSSLDIEAKANEENATVEIIGNENLQQGENTITILVSNSETDESATYQITVNKNVKEEVIASTQFGTKQIILIVAVLVLIAIIVGAIIYKIRLSRNDEDDEIEFPGADELDKALAEHQELAEDDWQNKWEDSWNDDWQNEDDSEFGENGEQVQEDKANVLDSYIINKNAERKDKNNYKEDSKKQIDNHWSKNQNDENNDYHNSDNYSRRRGKHF